MDNRPIGVFDSGLGGLTTVRELKKILPNEDIIYLGDTGRVPYGTRGHNIIVKYAQDNIRFMQRFDVKMIVSACATVSSTLPDIIWEQLPIVGVVEPASVAALKVTKGKIGVIGTSATIKSGSFPNKLNKLKSGLEIKAKACPLFVPLVECGMFDKDNQITKLTIELYLKEFLEYDTLILGCTHYPILKSAIQHYLPNTHLIDSGAQTANWVKDRLEKSDMLNRNNNLGEIKYYVTDSVESFAQSACIFLGEDVSENIFHIPVDDL